MTYKNPKELLTAATALPAAIEAKLPAGAPSLSTRLLEATDKMPDLPDFPMDLPDLPAIPELPTLPELPGTPTLGRRYVSQVEVKPVAAKAAAAKARANGTTSVTPLEQSYTQPLEGVAATVVTTRGM